MYAASQSYINAIRATTRTDRLVGILVYADGEELPLSERALGENSVKITQACIEGSEVQFGSAISGELQLSIRSEESRYRFYGAKIRLFYGIQTVDGWEDIPLGEFTVAEPERKQKLVHLTAYDNLILMDKEYDGRPFYGTPFKIMVEVCKACGVEFGMTEEEVSALPNGDQYIQIDTTSGITTYRGAAKVLAQMLASFVVADRSGRIVFRRYGKEVTTTLAKTNRYSSTAADYQCKYVGVVIKSDTREFSSYDVDAGEGLELKMPNAPAWDYGLDDTLQARTDNVLNELRTIEYTPSTISMPGNPALDCGDLMELIMDDGNVITLLTEYTWSFRGRMSVKSKGVNPYMKTVEPQKAQAIRQLEKTTNSKKLIFYSFSNPAKVVVQNDTPAELAQVTFVTTENTSAMFMAQLPLLVECEDTVTEQTEETSMPVIVTDSEGTAAAIKDSDGNPLSLTVRGTNTIKTVTCGYVDVQVEYYLDGTLVDYELTQRCHKGKHILSLFYAFASLGEKANYQWQVKVKVVGGCGTATIPARAFRATVTGQGMASTDIWDGTLNFDETVPTIALSNVSMIQSMEEEYTVDTQVPVSSALQEKVARINMVGRLKLKGFTGEAQLNPVQEQQTITAKDLNYAERYVELSDNGMQLRTVWQYESAEESIDVGQMVAVKAVTGDLTAVEEVLVVGV